MALTENESKDEKRGIIHACGRRCCTWSVEENGQVDILEPRIRESTLIVPQREWGNRPSQESVEKDVVECTRAKQTRGSNQTPELTRFSNGSGSQNEHQTHHIADALKYTRFLGHERLSFWSRVQMSLTALNIQSLTPICTSTEKQEAVS